MRVKQILLLAILTLNIGTGLAQEYFYVNDRDMFALLREEPARDAAVADTLYHLQMVKTGERRGGWVEVLSGNAGIGWVHSSRLRAMPEGAGEYLDRLSASYYREPYFVIASVDTPHIVIHSTDLFRGRSVPGRDYNEYLPVPVIFSPWQEVEVHDIRAGKELMTWGGLNAIYHVWLYRGRVMLTDEYAQYTFMEGPGGQTCISIIPVMDLPPAVAPERVEEAIRVAGIFRSRIEGKHPQAVSIDYGNEEDRWIFQALYAGYRAGDERARTLYHFVLRHSHSDGSATQDKMSRLHQLWVLEHTGITPIAELTDPFYWQ